MEGKVHPRSTRGSHKPSCTCFLFNLFRCWVERNAACCECTNARKSVLGGRQPSPNEDLEGWELVSCLCGRKSKHVRCLTSPRPKTWGELDEMEDWMCEVCKGED